jgi:hypothetical protein
VKVPVSAENKYHQPACIDHKLPGNSALAVRVLAQEEGDDEFASHLQFVIE